MTTRPVALVVVNFGTPRLVADLLASLTAHDDQHLVAEVLLVDSGFPTRGDLRTSIAPDGWPFPVRFLQQTGTAYGAALTLGVHASTAPFVALANSDLLWPPGAVLEPLIAALERDTTSAAAGPQQVFPAGRWQRSFGPFPSVLEGLGSVFLLEAATNALRARRMRRDAAPRPVPYLDGAFLVVRRAHFLRVKGFDPAFDYYAEDADLGWRFASEGWHCLFVPAARIQHLRGAETTAVSEASYLRRLYAAKRRFVARHRGPWSGRAYGVLQRIHGVTQALVYSAVALLARSPRWRVRAASARTALRALWRGPT
ncbi:MAG: glycosyltransferase family 2 protein [Gemmatimonadales bacterium]